MGEQNRMNNEPGRQIRTSRWAGRSTGLRENSNTKTEQFDVKADLLFSDPVWLSSFHTLSRPFSPLPMSGSQTIDDQVQTIDTHWHTKHNVESDLHFPSFSPLSPIPMLSRRSLVSPYVYKTEERTPSGSARERSKRSLCIVLGLRRCERDTRLSIE